MISRVCPSAMVTPFSPNAPSTPQIMAMPEGRIMNGKEKVGTAFEVLEIAREIAACAGAEHSLGEMKVFSGALIPIALSKVVSEAKVLIKNKVPTEELVLATAGLGEALGSSASAVSSTAAGIYMTLGETVSSWVSILGVVSAGLGLFSVLTSGLNFHYSRRVAGQIDQLIKDEGPDRLAKIDAYLIKLKGEDKDYLSKHFNLRSGGAEKVKMLIKKAFLRSDEEKVSLLETLLGRVTKKKNADARQFVIVAIASTFTLICCFHPFGLVACIVSAVAVILLFANKAYRIKASMEPLMQAVASAGNSISELPFSSLNDDELRAEFLRNLDSRKNKESTGTTVIQLKPRVEDEYIPSASTLNVRPAFSGVG